MRGGRLDGWEILAAALITGLVTSVAPYASATFLAFGFVGLIRADRIDTASRASLAALAGVALAAMLWGPQGAIGAGLAWRVAATLAHDAGHRLHIHAWTAPMAVLAWRLDAPHLLVAGLACIAIVAWLDWIVRVLADLRLDTPAGETVNAFVGSQIMVLAPLLVFPTPLASLTAFAAIGLARTLAWETRAAPAYAMAR